MEMWKYQCPACGLTIRGPEGLEDMPSRRLDLCKACNYYDKVLPIVAVVFFATALIILFLPCFGLARKQMLGISGLSFDISGVTLLLGKMERPVVVSGLIRGKGKDPLETALPKHVWQTRIGLLLVIVGFVLQASIFLI